MKKRLLVILLCNLAGLFAEEIYRKKAYLIPDFMYAQKSYELSDFCAKQFKNQFLPSLYINEGFKSGGRYFEDWNEISGSNEFLVCQKIPGGAEFTTGFSLPYAVSADERLSEWALNFSSAVTVPLLFSSFSGRDYGRRQLNQFFLEKELSDLNYKSLQLEILKSYLEKAGNYLYSRELYFVNEERKNLIERETEEYQKLLEHGKFSVLDFSAKTIDLIEFQNNFAELKKLVTDCEFDLLEAGVSLEELDYSLEKFLDFWIYEFEGYAGSVFYSERLSYLNLEKAILDFYDSELEYVPKFSASVGYKSDAVDMWKGVDVTSGAWNVSFSVNFKLFPGCDVFSENKKLKLFMNKSREDEKRLTRTFKFESEKRKLEKSNAEFYVKTMKSTYEIEKERVKLFQSLYNSGKITFLEKSFQENTAQLSSLYHQKARLDYLLSFLSY